MPEILATHRFTAFSFSEVYDSPLGLVLMVTVVQQEIDESEKVQSAGFVLNTIRPGHGS
jgi:hypothetical protein